MKKIFLSLFVIISVATVAQQKVLTMQDAMLNARTSLAPENMRQLQFLKGTEEYAYIKKIDGVDEWIRGNFSLKEEKTLLKLSQINRQLKGYNVSELKTMPAVQFVQNIYSIIVKGIKYSFELNTDGKKDEASSKDSMPAGADESILQYKAYLKNNNLFVAKYDDAKQVTTDGSENIVYASSVHRDEFGINKGTFWNNTGNMLAFYRMDQSMVNDYPIIDWTAHPAKNENIKYPMAGGKSHEVTVGVYNTETNKTIWLKTQDGIFNDATTPFEILNNTKERYLTNIAWSADDKYVFVAIVNRAQNHVWLNKYDATTGNYLSTLFEETNDKYFEPLVPMLFVKNKPNMFIWQSKRDGWNHLYLYNVHGKLQTQLTKGKWDVIDVKGFDEKGENIFYVSTEESPINKNLYLLNLKTLKTTRLTKASGVHNISISNSGKYFIDNYSNTQT
ncbi:MAG: DPP IV N-terminal domain-containing protein, partial [Ferruginibacter sp.]